MTEEVKIEKLGEVSLTQEELQQLNARDTALNSMNTLAQMGQRERQLYFVELIKKYNLDMKKSYNVHKETGVISELKSEPVKNESKEESGKSETKE